MTQPIISKRSFSPIPVTVLMSVFNELDNVKQAIESIVRQTYDYWDMVIVDDNSSDGTYELLMDIAQKDKRIKVFRNNINLGLAASLNKGFRKTNNELIARMDADDISYCDRLEKQVTFMKRNPNVDVLGTGAIIKSRDNNVNKCVNMPKEHDDIVRILPRRSPFFHPSVMIRRDFFQRFGLYNNRLRKAQDYELWARTHAQATFHNLQQPLIQYNTADYKKSFMQNWYMLKVRLSCSYNYGFFIEGSFYAMVGFIKNILISLNLYIPRLLRQNIL